MPPVSPGTSSVTTLAVGGGSAAKVPSELGVSNSGMEPLLADFEVFDAAPPAGEASFVRSAHIVPEAGELDDLGYAAVLEQIRRRNWRLTAAASERLYLQSASAFVQLPLMKLWHSWDFLPLPPRSLPPPSPPARPRSAPSSRPGRPRRWRA